MVPDFVDPTGRVVAVEANPTTFELLKVNLTLIGRGTLVHCAVTIGGGEVEIVVSDLGDIYSSLKPGGQVTGDSLRSFKAPGKSLDAVVTEQGLDRVDVEKVDIEGAELDVIRSAVQVMKELRPVIVVEYSTNTWPKFGATAEDLLRLAADRGYAVKLYDLARCRLIEPPPGLWNSGYANVLLLPNDRVAG